MHHTSFAQLLEHLELEGARASESSGSRDPVSEHLASGCSKCVRELEWVERFVTLVRDDTSVQPPEWVVRRAIALFPQERRDSGFARARKTLAALVFDSFAQPHLAGVRRIGEMGRQLLYRAGDYDIDLRFIPADPRVEEVVGQVLSRTREDLSEVSNLEVTAHKGKKKIASAVTDASGIFTFGLSQGSLLIRVKTRDGIIELPNVATSRCG